MPCCVYGVSASDMIGALVITDAVCFSDSGCGSGFDCVCGWFVSIEP